MTGKCEDSSQTTRGSATPVKSDWIMWRMQQSELRIVVSNTGPLVSALQCGRLDIVRQLYDVVHIPSSVLAELVTHGAGPEIIEMVRAGFIVVHDDLTEEERAAAKAIAEAIADAPKSHKAVRKALLDCRRQGTHYGTAFIERIYGRLREEAR